ncbi:MAG TPA: PHP-associated domain-containing protein [Ktedonobacterales bacterium]|nr:PHP-associated domain-containing protein [Ktedonobacterales bacterium]
MSGRQRGPHTGRKRVTGLADLHMHTTYSDGVGSVEEVLAFIHWRTALDVIAITDHDTIEGALRARDLAARQRLPFEVIVGEEVSTREGHVLTLFLQKRIPPGLSVERTIELAHAQGGLAIIAHPFNPVFRHSVQRPVVDRLLRQPELHPDGIETLNGSFAGIGSSRVALELTRSVYHWAETGGSDAHTPSAIGCALTRYPGSGVEELRQAISQRATYAQGSYWRARDYVTYVSHTLAYGINATYEPTSLPDTAFSRARRATFGRFAHRRVAHLIDSLEVASAGGR